MLLYSKASLSVQVEAFQLEAKLPESKCNTSGDKKGKAAHDGPHGSLQ